jgi:hypothetical protein
MAWEQNHKFIIVLHSEYEPITIVKTLIGLLFLIYFLFFYKLKNDLVFNV